MPLQIELTEFGANLAAAWILAVAGSTVFLELCRAYLAVRRRLRLRSVFAEGFLHSPGHNRRGKLRLQVGEIHALLASFAVLPLLFATVLVADPDVIVPQSITLYWLAIILCVTAIAGHHVHMLVRRLSALPALRYELSADMAVSQGLQRIARRDFAVFHDAMLGEENSAKVVVGKQGVFALFLHVHPRPASDSQNPPTATFDGRRVCFPDGTDLDVAQQIQSLAKEAETRFSKVTGSTIKVCPVMAIPGWRIECTEQPEFPVVNESNIDMIASWVRPEDSLLDEEFEQIVSLLSEACLDPRYKHHASVARGQMPASQVARCR